MIHAKKVDESVFAQLQDHEEQFVVQVEIVHQINAVFVVSQTFQNLHFVDELSFEALFLFGVHNFQGVLVAGMADLITCVDFGESAGGNLRRNFVLGFGEMFVVIKLKNKKIFYF